MNVTGYLDGVYYTLTVDTDPDTAYPAAEGRLGGSLRVRRWLATYAGESFPAGPPPAGTVVLDLAEVDTILAALYAGTRVLAVSTDEDETWRPAPAPTAPPGAVH